MNKQLIAFTLSTLVTCSAFATIDSYTSVQIPNHGLHESEVCLVTNQKCL
jgi:hypothetical protein